MPDFGLVSLKDVGVAGAATPTGDARYADLAQYATEIARGDREPSSPHAVIQRTESIQPMLPLRGAPRPPLATPSLTVPLSEPDEAALLAQLARHGARLGAAAARVDDGRALEARAALMALDGLGERAYNLSSLEGLKATGVIEALEILRERETFDADDGGAPRARVDMRRRAVVRDVVSTLFALRLFVPRGADDGSGSSSDDEESSGDKLGTLAVAEAKRLYDRWQEAEEAIRMRSNANPARETRVLVAAAAASNLAPEQLARDRAISHDEAVTLAEKHARRALEARHADHTIRSVEGWRNSVNAGVMIRGVAPGFEWAGERTYLLASAPGKALRDARAMAAAAAAPAPAVAPATAADAVQPMETEDVVTDVEPEAPLAAAAPAPAAVTETVSRPSQASASQDDEAVNRWARLVKENPTT